MPPKPPSRGFSFFGIGASNSVQENNSNRSNTNVGVVPDLRLVADKEVYRPGDTVTVSVDVCNLNVENNEGSFFVERFGFEVVGIEKLDTQWFATATMQKRGGGSGSIGGYGSKRQRGELNFLDCSAPSIVSNQIISPCGTKTYILRTELPEFIPPTYKGTTIRYLYYARCTVSGKWLILENGHTRRDSMKDLIQLEARIPLQIWVSQKTSGLLTEESQNDGIFRASSIQMDIYWKEKEGDSDWVRANEASDGPEEGYDSSRDEVSSVSSYNPTKGNIETAFGSSLSLQSFAARSSNRDAQYHQGERSSLSSYMALPQLSVAEVLYDSTGDVLSPRNQTQAIYSPSHLGKHKSPFSPDDDTGSSSVPEAVEPVTSEGFSRGRSYNIRLDDQILLRFSPKNSDSTYYFSDMIGGTLTFFHEEGIRRCLEVSITLEISETISQQFVHPSRRNSPTITKIQSDHHEVVADLVQTSFLFSIPMDGPMTFSTPHVSVQWALRFEFFTTPKNVNWKRYDHPLLVDGRDKGEWVLPITVHAPPPRTQPAQTKNEIPSVGPFWSRN